MKVAVDCLSNSRCTMVMMLKMCTDSSRVFDNICQFQREFQANHMCQPCCHYHTIECLPKTENKCWINPLLYGWMIYYVCLFTISNKKATVKSSDKQWEYNKKKWVEIKRVHSCWLLKVMLLYFCFVGLLKILKWNGIEFPVYLNSTFYYYKTNF